MSLLEKLSPEFLDMVLDYANVSHLAIRLLKIGNRSLTSRLLTGITKVTLCPLEGVKLKIPRGLLQMQFLRQVSIISSRHIMKDPKHWRPLLQSLPRTLETLELCTADSENAFYNFGPDWSYLSPELPSTEYSRGSSTCFDIGQLFPQLRTLKWSIHSSFRLETLPGPP